MASKRSLSVSWEACIASPISLQSVRSRKVPKTAGFPSTSIRRASTSIQKGRPSTLAEGCPQETGERVPERTCSLISWNRSTLARSGYTCAYMSRPISPSTSS